MPYYKPLKKLSQVERKRTIAGIQRIRSQLFDHEFPIKNTSTSLILGTWNLRNFDDDRFNFGKRTKESLHYIAEIISRFDVLAVQEICDDLTSLNELLVLLGPQYDYIVTDVTHGSLGGNQERLGFIYDKSKVRFKGIAGEVVLPKKLQISVESDDKRQFARTPFGVEFQSGWFRFLFSTVHIYFGSASKNTPQHKRRIEEIKAIAKYLAKIGKANEANQILVGDFNIEAHGSKGFNVLEKNSFSIVKNREGSNRDQTKFYDQISFLKRNTQFRLIDPLRENRVFQFFDSVYSDDSFLMYKSVIVSNLKTKLKQAESELAAATSKTKKKKFEKRIKTIKEAAKTDESMEKYYRKWRTFQMSDHLPLWVELEIDFSDDYLKYLETF